MQPRVVLEHHPWKVCEKDYQPNHNIYYESNFTLGNGYMGARGCLEEGFTDEKETYLGTYIAGIYDNFNGPYVELVNCPNFFGAKLQIGDEVITFPSNAVSSYIRTLDMRKGILTREFVWTDSKGNQTKISWQRFLSMSNVHLGCQRFRATPLNHELPITLDMMLDSSVYNRRQQDWPPLKEIIPNYHFDLQSTGVSASNKAAWLSLSTKTTKLELAFCSQLLTVDGTLKQSETQQGIVQTIVFNPAAGQEVGIDRVISVYTSRDSENCLENAGQLCTDCYDTLLKAHQEVWLQHWKEADIVISGDDSAQQGVRFNIFNLIQANAYWDPKVSLAAKLLSHTRYKGNAFWDTETFMFPFFLHTNPQAAKNLLLYRYNLLSGAKEKAKERRMYGAMYPWCSAHDGSEQCESWEYGDTEIHITADIAYAYDQYIKSTNDIDFFNNYAVEVFIETARYWADRVAWNEEMQKYTLLAVKGPDEYCAVTNNNMYTNFMAAYNLRLAANSVEVMADSNPGQWDDLKKRLDWKTEEADKWRVIADGLYQNWDKKNPDLLIQDDTFLMQPLEDLSVLKNRKKPVLEILGYEYVMRVRILRQTDVLLLMYLLNDHFTKEQKQTAFDYYEPITTHDSSLSYNTHCIMAAELGMDDKAVDYFYKTCRLDLDDEFDTVRSGLHGASMGGTWMSVVNGFAGFRIKDGIPSFNPMLPENWNELSFKLKCLGRNIEVKVTKQDIELTLLEGESITVLLNGTEKLLQQEA